MGTIIHFVLTNWQSLISVAAIFLSGGVALAHVFHADKLEKSLKDLADVLEKLGQPTVSSTQAQVSSTQTQLQK